MLKRFGTLGSGIRMLRIQDFRAWGRKSGVQGFADWGFRV